MGNTNTSAGQNQDLYKKIAKFLQKGMSTAQIAQEINEPIGKTLALIRETKKNVQVKDVPFHIKNKKVLEEHNALGHTSAYIAKILNARKVDVQKALMRLGLEDNIEDASVSVKQMSEEEKQALAKAKIEKTEKKNDSTADNTPSADTIYLQMIARKHKTDKEIAKAIGKGINQTRSLLDKNNIEYEVWQDRRYIRSEFPIGAEEMEEMLYEHTIGEIAEELGVSYTAARRAVHDYGLSDLANTRMRTLLDEGDLRKFIDQGLSITEICKKFNVGYSVVRYNLDEYGLEVQRKERPCVLDEQQCLAYAEEKKTISDIVRETGLGYWAVRHSYKKSGIEPYVSVAAYQELVDDHEDDLRELVAEGNSMRDIAEYMGVSYECIRKALEVLDLHTDARVSRIDVDIDEIAALAKDGLSMQKIADALGVSREVVKNRIGNNAELSSIYADSADKRAEKIAEEKRARLVGIQDPKELDLIRNMAENGATQKEICEKTGRTLTAVRTALSSMGVKTCATRSNKVDVPVDVLKAYIAIGASPEDIAEDLELSKQIVYSRLREAKLSRIIRTRSDAKAAYVAHALSGENLYDRYVQQKKSVEEIAQEAMTDKDTVYRLIRLHGISRTGRRKDERTPGEVLDAKTLGADEISFIEKMITDGHTAAEMAHALNCSIAEVYIAMGNINYAEIMPNMSARQASGRPVGRAAALLTHENLVKWHVEENKSAKEIAEETGLSKYTVYDYLRRAGLGSKDTGPSYKQIAEDHADDIEKMVEEGKSVRKIAEALNTTSNRIRMTLDYLGIKSAGTTARDGKMTYRQLAEECGDEIKKLAGRGKSVREIAEELDSTRERVKQAMGLLNVSAGGKKETIELDEEEVCEMLLDGDDVADVAKELGVSTSVIYAALRKWGRTTVGTKKKA